MNPCKVCYNLPKKCGSCAQKLRRTREGVRGRVSPSKRKIEVKCSGCGTLKLVRKDSLKAGRKYQCLPCGLRRSPRGLLLREDLYLRNGVGSGRDLLAKLIRFLRKNDLRCNNSKVLDFMGGASPNTLWKILREGGHSDKFKTKSHTSEGENEIFQFLTEDLGISPDHITRNDRKVLGGKEIDLLVLPSQSGV